MTTGKVSIPAVLVPHLRAGVREHLHVSLETLIVLVQMPRVDLAIYAPAEERYTQTAELLKLIGFNDRPDQSDVTVPRGPWVYLILRVVESQHGVEQQRPEHAEIEALRRLSRAYVGALEQLADELRRQFGAKPRRVTPPSRGAHVRCMRLPRHRGDGR